MTKLARENCIMKTYDYLTEEAVDMLSEYNLNLFRAYLKRHGYRVVSTVGELTSWKMMRQRATTEEVVMWLSIGGDLCNTIHTINSTRRFERAIGYHEVMCAISDFAIKEDQQWKAFVRNAEERDALLKWLQSNDAAYNRTRVSGCVTNESFVPGQPYLFIPSFVYMQPSVAIPDVVLSEKGIKLLRSESWKLEASTAEQQKAVVDWLTHIFPEYSRDQLLPSTVFETLYCVNGVPEWKNAHNPHVPRIKMEFLTQTTVRSIDISPLIDKQHQKLAELKEQLKSIQAQIAELE